MNTFLLRRLGLAVLALLGVSTIQGQISDDTTFVGTGRTLVEVDVYHSLYRDPGVRTEYLNIAPVLVTHGLNDRTDVGIGFDGYYRERTRTAGTTSTAHDWGDVTLRCKYSLWGHDHAEHVAGNTALAVLPYVKLPLKLGEGGSDRVEGGLILPFSVALPSDWSLFIMTEFDVVADSADSGHEFMWTESLVLSRSFTEKISGYVEFYSVLPSDDAYDWSAQLNLGFYYCFTPDFYLDAGCNFGLNDAAPDLQPFIGLSYLY